MANRATDGAVKSVLDTDLTDLSAYINLANTVVNTHLLGNGLSDDLLLAIEVQLSAHFVVLLSEREVVREKIGDAEVTYRQGGDNDGIKATRYGHAACMLDTTGILNNLGAAKPSVDVL